jgi:hypothetical protein
MKFLAVLSLAALAVPLQADLIVAGTPADSGIGFCQPFSCGYAGEYQQVYASSLFPSPVTITGLEFYDTQSPNSPSWLATGDMSISLSSTPAGPDSLSSTLSSNIGGDNTLVFSGNLSQPWASGDTLVIGLMNPFLYDPAAGNLLMDVNVAGMLADFSVMDAPDDINVYFDVNGYNSGDFGGNSIMGAVSSATGTVESGFGLVTGFETDPSDTPEPASLLLVGIGATAFFLARRRVS